MCICLTKFLDNSYKLYKSILIAPANRLCRHTNQTSYISTYMYFFVHKRYYKFLIFCLICNTVSVITVSFLDSWYVFVIKSFWDIKFQDIKRISFQMQPTQKMIIIDIYYEWYDGDVVYQKSNILANIINDFCWSLFGLRNIRIDIILYIKIKIIFGYL